MDQIEVVQEQLAEMAYDKDKAPYYHFILVVFILPFPI